MPRPISLAIPHPCHESWAAMTPTATGRHCAACAQTVVDFTQHTDAEILAYLARAASGRTCGRFAAGQLERPLQRAVSATPTTRWRAWLAAAVAVWGLREGSGETAKAQEVPLEMRQQDHPAFVPAQFRADKTRKELEAKLDTVIIRGVVRDSATHDGLPGVTVLVKNSTVGASTDEDGHFELKVPAGYSASGVVELQVKYLGFLTEERQVAATATAPALQVLMQADMKGMISGVMVVGDYSFKSHQPWPWHPRRFYNWSKYWLTRPFRRG